MSRNKRRTGIFDLNDIIGSIQLPNFNGAFQQDDTELIAPPKILVDVTEVKEGKKGIKVANALLIVKEQMRLSGVRKATVKEYIYTFNRLVEAMRIEFLYEITLEVIFNWLSKLGDISEVSKQNRLRVIKAVLNRFYDNGWLEKNFWKDVCIRVDTKIKLPADEKQLSILLSLLDMTDFIQFRDAVAIQTIFKTGIRMNTLIQLKEKHIDFETNSLLLTGDIDDYECRAWICIDTIITIVFRDIGNY
ncbi:tyrosine-type recombinase/integrase [Lysinibacillus sp. NPDC058147]|uniref:tyrosine-type recombinase/integrase n=1 Tax=unclassified Lysinibacillus TaxID=2636778 RepID=UPI0036D919C8